jgi:hypothetical protein
MIQVTSKRSMRRLSWQASHASLLERTPKERAASALRGATILATVI